MNKKQRKKFNSEFLRRFAVVFMLVIIIVSIAGFLVFRFAPEGNAIRDIFAIGSEGIKYSHILIIAGIILVIVLLSFISLAVPRRQKKIKSKVNRYDALFKEHKIYTKKKIVK